jgi:hypothetical protein
VRETSHLQGRRPSGSPSERSHDTNSEIDCALSRMRYAEGISETPLAGETIRARLKSQAGQTA